MRIVVNDQDETALRHHLCCYVHGGCERAELADMQEPDVGVALVGAVAVGATGIARPSWELLPVSRPWLARPPAGWHAESLGGAELLEAAQGHCGAEPHEAA